jgi:hypothetical protein
MYILRFGNATWKSFKIDPVSKTYRTSNCQMAKETQSLVIGIHSLSMFLGYSPSLSLFFK